MAAQLTRGKAIAAIATNGGEPLEFLEVVGKGRALKVPPLPFIAVPTTAGTGSEVTRNAVLGSPEHGVKASLRSPLMLPRIALVDPELTYGLPPAVTASTGLDALTQLIEPYVSVRANPLVDAICVEGIRRVAGALRRAYHDGADVAARRDMALGSLFGGLALANAGLGVVHGFAAPLGGTWKAPHGALCAAILPHGMAANVDALRARAPQHPALGRYATIASLLTGRNDARAEDGIDWVRELCVELNIPAAARLGYHPSRFARRGREGSPRQQHAGQSAPAHRQGAAGSDRGGAVRKQVYWLRRRLFELPLHVMAGFVASAQCREKIAQARWRLERLGTSSQKR